MIGNQLSRNVFRLFSSRDPMGKFCLGGPGLGFDTLRLLFKSTCSIMCNYQRPYISKIMPIIRLVFVNYAHVSKKGRNYASPFYFKFGENISITMQQTGKRQIYLP